MADNTTTGGNPDLSNKEVTEAKKEGLKQSIAAATIPDIDGLPGEEPDNLENRFQGSDEVLGLEPFLELSPDAFDKQIGNGKKEEAAGLTDTQLGGLYKLERNGQNRTPYVQSLRKRLKLKKDEHVPGAGGPGFTNDVSDLSDI